MDKLAEATPAPCICAKVMSHGQLRWEWHRVAAPTELRRGLSAAQYESICALTEPGELLPLAWCERISCLTLKQV